MVVLEPSYRNEMLSEQGTRPAQDGEVVSLDQRETGDTGLLGVRIRRDRDHAFPWNNVCFRYGDREFVSAAGALT